MHFIVRCCGGRVTLDPRFHRPVSFAVQPVQRTTRENPLHKGLSTPSTTVVLYESDRLLCLVQVTSSDTNDNTLSKSQRFRRRIILKSNMGIERMGSSPRFMGASLRSLCLGTVGLPAQFR
jgi:hypothetical protein